MLGLEPAGEAVEGVLGFRTGATRLVVYKSAEAGTNRANAVVWSCGNEIDAIVADLEAKGVSFEHYPQTGGMRLEGNIHVATSTSAPSAAPPATPSSGRAYTPPHSKRRTTASR